MHLLLYCSSRYVTSYYAKILGKVPTLARNMSTRSCSTHTRFSSDLEEGEEGVFDVGDCNRSPIKLVKKKERQRYTEDTSKEFFTLKFDLNVDIGMEIVQAVKKKSLRDVLSTVFEKKGIELSQVDLFLDQSNTPLSLGFEAYRLGGHYLRVRARPEELRMEKGVKDPRSLSLPIIRPSTAYSAFFGRVEHGSLGRREAANLHGQAHRRKNITEFLGDTNVSLDSVSQLSGFGTITNTGTDRWKNKAASRFSVLFSSSSSNGSISKECERVEQLQSKLHSYTLFGLPKMPQQLSFHRDSWEEEPNLEMEESWKELLENPEILTIGQWHQQEAIWELLQTESAYIKNLHVITDLFLCGLLNLQESGLLCDINPSRLFGNIQEIVHMHTLFWAEVLLPTLERSRQSRTMLNPVDLCQGFSTFGYRFRPYIHYCLEEESCMEYMRTLLKENELFRLYVTWAETHKQCSRLKLTDMLVKPHQRLTKYPLLLKSILKKTDEQIAREALFRMVASVEGFINSVDSQMRQREEKQKLAAIAIRIEAYEPVEGATDEVEKMLKEYNQFDLTAPVLGALADETRQLYLEGALRMKEGKDSKMDVHCFLFTDVLLITKPVKRVEKVKVIRQPLIIRNIVCRDLKDSGAFLLIYLNEFRSAVASYCFQANSATHRCSWVQAIYNAQNQLERLCSVSMRAERDEEEEDEMESSISTSSSPSFQHKEPLQKRSSEMLSVVLMEQPDEVKRQLLLDSEQVSLQSALYSDSSFTKDALPTDNNQTLKMRNDLVAIKLDPESRSRSIDSDYGTLLPESFIPILDLKEGMKREQREREVNNTGKVEGAYEEDDEADVGGNADDSIAWNGSQITVKETKFFGEQYNLQQAQMELLQPKAPYNASQECCSPTLWRHSPIHTRTENFALRSCSEDNLLQWLSSPVDYSRISNRNLSKSLTQLSGSSEHLQAKHGQSTDPSALSDKVTDTLIRAEDQIFHRAMSFFNEENVRVCDSVASQQLHLHRKLTKAQLQRMRTTMVLNSTLTASEV
ncbi:pleckstrin homology domain-containing family G member 5 isoform X2 [Silurus meridionalis]|uniref:pleckstrin homology domain-containing family G member 5 isoform X2 n=1 Tax=Silurus meridionalis TaxID=175797 RepID=UPI001EEC7F4C|nr:pleckstrin homology domain-containing family G member 5 isoform X2 [Silurus meridionalis]